MRGTGTVTDLAVASYLAKYSTKGTEAAGHTSARITPDTIDLYAHADGTHPERLIHACWRLGSADGPMYYARTRAPLGAHARLRRPLPHQSPPLLRHPHRPSPGPHQLPARPGHRTRPPAIRTVTTPLTPRPRSSLDPAVVRRNRLAHHRRRPPRQHRRRPGPQTPRSRTRRTRCWIFACIRRRGCVSTAALTLNRQRRIL